LRPAGISLQLIKQWPNTAVLFCHRSMQICQILVRGPRTAPSPPRNAPQKKWQQVIVDFVPPAEAEGRLSNIANMVAEFTQAGGAPILD